MHATRRPGGPTVALLAGLVASCSPNAAGLGRDEVASVTITPTAVEVGVGGTVPFQATVKDAADRVLGDRRVVWTSSDGEVASVSEVGVATARHAGSAQISANSEGKFAIAVVTVVAPPPPVSTVAIIPNKVQLEVGDTFRLQAVAYDPAGNVLNGRTFIWVSSKPNVATVDGGGLVKGVGKGSATITATSEGKTGTASVTVSR